MISGPSSGWSFGSSFPRVWPGLNANFLVPKRRLFPPTLYFYLGGWDHRRCFEWLFSQFSLGWHVTSAMLNAQERRGLCMQWMYWDIRVLSCCRICNEKGCGLNRLPEIRQLCGLQDPVLGVLNIAYPLILPLAMSPPAVLFSMIPEHQSQLHASLNCEGLPVPLACPWLSRTLHPSTSQVPRFAVACSAHMSPCRMHKHRQGCVELGVSALSCPLTR